VAMKRGRFERAHGGTIFLDEVGELPLGAQTRLLRVLQEKEIERVGGTRQLKVDIRVIAATHRDLQQMMEDGDFRNDLYFRLQVFPIVIPPLRERTGDIPALVQHFMQKKSRQMKLPEAPTLDPGAIGQLMAYDWPGNIRELENAVERALIISRGKPLSFYDFGLNSKPKTGSSLDPSLQDFPLLDTIVSDHIQKALQISKGKVEGKGGGAELLGINHGTLRHRMRKLGISFGRGSSGTGSSLQGGQ